LIKTFILKNNPKTNKKVSRIIRNYKSLTYKEINRLRNFSFSLNYIFGYSTYEEMRLAFIRNMKRESKYIIPGEDVILSEIERASSLGMVSMVSKSCKETSNFYTKITNFLDCEEDKNYLRFFPIFTGCLNHIKSLVDVSLDFKSGEISLHQAIKSLVHLDIDKIFSTKERNIILELYNIGKIFKQGFRDIEPKEEQILIIDEFPLDIQPVPSFLNKPLLSLNNPFEFYIKKDLPIFDDVYTLRKEDETIEDILVNTISSSQGYVAKHLQYIDDGC
jgi:hypothetical protein